MLDDIEKILVSEQELSDINARLGAQITKDFKGKNLLVLGILKGCVFFMTDLVRHIDLPLSIDFMSVSSYGSGTESTGRVKITKDIDIDLDGYDVLIVEDILDSGRTLKYVSEILKTRGANSISIVTLLDKPERRVAQISPDYVGCDVPDEFVVGYGLDYDQKYRNLPLYRRTQKICLRKIIKYYHVFPLCCLKRVTRRDFLLSTVRDNLIFVNIDHSFVCFFVINILNNIKKMFIL